MTSPAARAPANPPADRPACPPNDDALAVTPDDGPMPVHVRCEAALRARFASQTITHERREGARWRQEYVERREYDERGDLIEHVYTGGARPLPRWTYTYDAPHQLREMRYRAGAERLARAYRYEFDDGRLARAIMSNPAERVEFISAYRYEPDGAYSVVRTRRHLDGAEPHEYPDGSERYDARGLQERDCGVNTCMLYEHDERGHRRRVREQHPDGEHSYRHWEHRFDADGRVLERVTGGVRVVRAHDERGLVTEELEYFGGELSRRRRFEHTPRP